VNEGENPRADRPQWLGQDHLLNVITAFTRRARAGWTYHGKDLAAHERAGDLPRRGDAHLLQRSRLCLPLSIFDNLMIGNHRGSTMACGSTCSAALRSRRSSKAICRSGKHWCGLSASRSPAAWFEPAARVNMIDRRRIEICRALISQPTLLLLDERRLG